MFGVWVWDSLHVPGIQILEQQIFCDNLIHHRSRYTQEMATEFCNCKSTFLQNALPDLLHHQWYHHQWGMANHSTLCHEHFAYLWKNCNINNKLPASSLHLVHTLNTNNNVFRLVLPSVHSKSWTSPCN